MLITDEYLKSLPEIYSDILAAFPRFDATRKVGYGLSFQSLCSALNGKYDLAEIRKACENMAQADMMEIRNEIFVHPTDEGEELIGAITGEKAPPLDVPPFIPPSR